VFPIYQAIAYEKIELKGGSTKPLVFTIDKNGVYIPYVVKIFSENQQFQYDALAKECLAYTIAQEFELPQPDAALIMFGEELLANIPEEIAHRLKQNTQSLHYGTQLMNDYILFHKNFHGKDLETSDHETLFAFDALIYNLDRNYKKPNLLVRANDYLLIDHELSLPISESFLRQAKENDFSYIYNNPKFSDHIFLPFLRERMKKDVVKFSKFDILLGVLNISKLEKVNEFLKTLNCSDKNFDTIKSYIYEIKRQRVKFIKSLNNFL
jgi:hypothetical protein